MSPTADGVLIKRDPKQRLKAVDVETAIYPGFATDLQAQFMALMTTAEGVSTVRETASLDHLVGQRTDQFGARLGQTHLAARHGGCDGVGAHCQDVGAAPGRA